MTNKWERREKKQNKQKYGMRVHGKNMLRIENDRENRKKYGKAVNEIIGP